MTRTIYNPAQVEQIREEEELMEELMEIKEDLELEYDIVTRQLARYEGTEFWSRGAARYNLPIQESCGQQEQRLGDAARAPDLIRLRIENELLESQLNLVKEQLAECQRKECARLHLRRQAALAEHRRKYELEHPHLVNDREVGDDEDDGDSDYDTLDI